MIDVQGLTYEILTPASVIARLEQATDANGCVSLITYHYLQITPSRGVPCLVGFLSEVERDFFLDFIKVSGIGPRAAVKALDRPISDIAAAIAAGDEKFLKGLPGIGLQKAREIVAKLQAKSGKYGLIQDHTVAVPQRTADVPDWQQEALDVLLQLQYKMPEARQMIETALKRSPGIQTAEDLLNTIYKQRIRTDG